jgi:hypothetical protein
VFVHEQEGAEWLPFQPFGSFKATTKGGTGRYVSEVAWVKGFGAL